MQILDLNFSAWLHLQNMLRCDSILHCNPISPGKVHEFCAALQNIARNPCLQEDIVYKSFQLENSGGATHLLSNSLVVRALAQEWKIWVLGPPHISARTESYQLGRVEGNSIPPVEAGPLGSQRGKICEAWRRATKGSLTLVHWGWHCPGSEGAMIPVPSSQ